MYLRAGVILSNSYYENPLKNLPVMFNIGGYHARYHKDQGLYEHEAFKKILVRIRHTTNGHTIFRWRSPIGRFIPN